MLAAKMYGKRDIRLEEIDIPKITSGEVLLKVKAAAVCGTDVRMFTYGTAGITEDHPIILGHEVSGIIADVGSDVKSYQIGQRVAVAPNMGCGICDQCVSGNGHRCRDYKALGINLNGGFAEYMVIPARAVSSGNIAVLDDKVSFEEAAVNEPLSCTYNCFERCKIGPGKSVLVIGAGPIGIMHTMLARMAGANPVFINDLSEERLQACRNFDSGLHTISTNLKETIMEYTNSEGVDVCITACPSPAVQSIALELTAVRGWVNFFGGIPEDKQKVALNTNLIHYKQLNVTGTTRASLIQYRKTLSFISKGVLDVNKLITKRFALSEIDKGFEYAEKGIGLKNVICM